MARIPSLLKGRSLGSGDSLPESYALSFSVTRLPSFSLYCLNFYNQAPGEQASTPRNKKSGVTIGQESVNQRIHRGSQPANGSLTNKEGFCYELSVMGSDIYGSFALSPCSSAEFHDYFGSCPHAGLVGSWRPAQCPSA